MYNLSEIVGKKVIGLYEAEFAGEISGISLDKTLCRIKFVELNDKNGDKKYFTPESIVTVGSDAVVLKNLGKILTRFSIPPVFAPSPVGTPVFNNSGNSLGVVTDLVLDGFTVKEINASGVGYTPESVLSRSDELIVINDSGEKIKLVPPVTKVPDPKAGKDVSVKAHANKTPKSVAPVPVAAKETSEATQATEAKVTTLPTVEIPPSKPVAVTVPKLLNGDSVSVTKSPATDDKRGTGYAFLLGKTVTKAIKSDDGAVILSVGDVVDETSLTAATNANKLVQLALHSK